jgi:crotonobetainyl-CoA:carnitine CoA-transferase CaiB-like acyl-CoA transferase
MASDDVATPLGTYRVVDFTHTIAGPYCTQLLADAGADVIKVEPPGGEYSRIRGPQRLGSAGLALSAYSACVNRDKRSIVIDLKNPKGVELCRRLIATADVVVENFAPSTLERLGISLASLRDDRPALITASINLLGVTSSDERASRGGMAIVAEAESGMLSILSAAGDQPTPLRVPLGDMCAGLAAYASIVSALLARERTGVGRHCAISMVGVLASLNSLAFTTEQIVENYEFETAGIGVFPTSNGHICLGVNSDSLWKRLVTTMGMPELATDPRFAAYVQRDSNVAEANALVAEWTTRHTSAEILERLGQTGVPCGRVLSAYEILSEQMDDRGFFWLIDDGIGGTIAAPANPLGLSSRDRHKIPRVAEDSYELVMQLPGMDQSEYATLSNAGVFGSTSRGETRDRER